MRMSFNVMPFYLILTPFKGSDDGSCCFSLVWPIFANTSEIGLIVFCWLIHAERESSMTNLKFPPIRKKDGWGLHCERSIPMILNTSCYKFAKRESNFVKKSQELRLGTGLQMTNPWVVLHMLHLEAIPGTVANHSSTIHCLFHSVSGRAAESESESESESGVRGFLAGVGVGVGVGVGMSLG